VVSCRSNLCSRGGGVQVVLTLHPPPRFLSHNANPRDKKSKSRPRRATTNTNTHPPGHAHSPSFPLSRRRGALPFWHSRRSHAFMSVGSRWWVSHSRPPATQGEIEIGKGRRTFLASALARATAAGAGWLWRAGAGSDVARSYGCYPFALYLC
jgi:hypothetical protein